MNLTIWKRSIDFIVIMLGFTSVVVITLAVLTDAAEMGFFPKRCFGDVGCFDNGGWFALRQPNKLPQSPEQISAEFLLNTRKNKNVQEPEVIKYDDMYSIRQSSFDFSKQTKILVHGFLASCKGGQFEEMASEFLDLMDVNVIRVDWKGGNGFPFEQATANTRVVGAQIGLLINKLCDQFNMKPSDFHVIGHSLGAHTAGYAGERVTGLGRITGLDPAEPYFQFLHSSIRLDPSDAEFVDVIHTDGQSIFNILVGGSGFGLMQKSGHVDFYPNGGLSQPGCEHKDLCKDIFKGNIKEITDKVACSHARAIALFNESLRSAKTGCSFSATSCGSFKQYSRGECGKCSSGSSSSDKGAVCGQMGINAKQTLNGQNGIKLFLVTDDHAPLCLK